MPCAPPANCLPQDLMNLPSGSKTQVASPVGEALWMKIRPSALSTTAWVLPNCLPSGSLRPAVDHLVGVAVLADDQRLIAGLVLGAEDGGGAQGGEGTGGGEAGFDERAAGDVVGEGVLRGRRVHGGGFLCFRTTFAGSLRHRPPTFRRGSRMTITARHCSYTATDVNDGQTVGITF